MFNIKLKYISYAILIFLMQQSLAHPSEFRSFTQEEKVPAELLKMPSFLISNGASTSLYTDLLCSYWKYLSDLERDKQGARFYPQVEQNEVRKLFLDMDLKIGQLAQDIDVKNLAQHRADRDYFVDRGHVEFAQFESWKRLHFIQGIVDLLPYVRAQMQWSRLRDHTDGLTMGPEDLYLLPVATPNLVEKSDFIANSIMPILMYGILQKPQYVDGDLCTPMLSIVHDRDHFRIMKYFWRHYTYKNATELKSIVQSRHAELMALDEELASQPKRRRKALAKKMVDQLFDDYHENGNYKVRTFSQLIEKPL